MKKYKHISLEEREKLYALHEQGFSLRSIAKQLERSQSSLTRELRRNVRYGNEYFENTYLPCKAEALARKRIVGQRKKASLKNPTIFLYVRTKLRSGLSPEQIAGRLRIDHPGESIGVETIYRYVYARRLQPKTRPLLSSYLPLARKKRMKQLGRRVRRHGKIPFAISIEKRAKSILGRKRIGHWETDNIIGKQSDKTALSVTVERKTRFTILTRLVNRKAVTKTIAITTRLNTYPIKTLTADNGKENSNHQFITKELHISMYFCHSYASWEKGTVENTNGRIRRFIPKGMSIDSISDEIIATIEEKLNNTPRKCLAFLTPYEKMAKAQLNSL